MKSFLVALSFLVSAVAFAETQTYAVSGMDCSGCVKNVVSKVCAKGTFAKCDVQIGQITIESKAGEKIDVEQLRKDIKVAGENYALGDLITAKKAKK